MEPTPADDTGAAKPWEHAKTGGGSASDPLATRFVASLGYDRRLYKHDIAGSIAHARMLHAVGLLTAEELDRIERGLADIQARIEAAGDDYGAAWPGWKTELEDVHMCIEAALIEQIGDAGRKLHTGRSRNDQVAVDLKLWIADVCEKLAGLFDDLLEAFFDLAQRQGEIVMPSYTHMQRAQPIVLGAELTAWMAALDRARRRMLHVMVDNGDNPLGSGAVAGSSLPLDRCMTAAALPLAGPPSANSIDATASRDAAIDFVYALAMTSMTLSRWAEQWVVYASTEFGFLRLDPQHTTGSSMMPQKQNPDMLELIRGRCGDVYGRLVALLTIFKGAPIGYNRDFQEDKRHVFAAYDCVTDCLLMAARIVRGAEFDEDHIAESLDRGSLDATSLSEYLVTRGVPFRSAHQMVGRMVRRCREQGLEQLSQLTLEQMNGLCAAVAGPGGDDAPACGNDVYDWLGAHNVVKRYQTLGNAGVSGFRQQLESWRERLQSTGD